MQLDYNPSLLPEVAEAIFALKIKHANIGEPFVLNLSGNYKSIFIKEDAHGKLYDSWSQYLKSDGNRATRYKTGYHTSRVFPWWSLPG